MSENTQHWPAMAFVWEQTGSPLRPAPEDVAAYQEFAREAVERSAVPRTPRVLLLGVTPEIYRLPWPEERDFVAVDHTPAMIARVWPGRPEEVLRAGWLDLPLPEASRDVALCDGGLHLLDYPAGQGRLIERLHAVLAPGALAVFRLFIPPVRREEPGIVLDDLLAGRVANLNILKLRLGMALQKSAEEGVAVREVWRVLHEACPDRDALARRLGWSPEHFSGIDGYRESPARYHFATREEVTELFQADGRFVLRRSRDPSYPLGERCPLVAFERR